MQAPSIATVKEQIEVYRKTRSYRKQAIPDEIISDLKILTKSLSISKLQRLSESIMKRVREPKSSADVIRVAPVTLLGAGSAMMLEISSPRGETISVRALSMDAGSIQGAQSGTKFPSWKGNQLLSQTVA